MQQKLEVEAVTQQQSLAVVKNMIRTSVRLLDNIDRKISEICYLRNLFDEDCFCKKNYAGIMINALHPMDTKEGSEPHIHNSEAWQLTRWLEEGVFGEFHSSLCPYTSRCSRKALSSRSGLRDLRPSRGQIPIPPDRNLFLYSLPPLPKSLLDAFTYPDTQHIQLEVKQNNERSVVSTDGVKNQAVLLSSVFVPTPQVILLRTLITLCSTLSPLPRERWITLQLYYYDDITALLLSFLITSQPPDYQPAYFEDTADSSIRPGDSSFVSDPFVIEAGRLRTVLLSLPPSPAIPRHVHEGPRHRVHAPADRSLLPAHRCRDAGARPPRRGRRAALDPRDGRRGRSAPRRRIRAEAARAGPSSRRARSICE